MKFRNIIDQIKPGNMKSSKNKLEINLNKMEDSTNMLVSGNKILGFLINDMLDYAQLSAGSFRKQAKKFDLI